MARPKNSTFGDVYSRQGSSNNLCRLNEAMRLLGCYDDTPERSARPGEPPRNREQRCAHGFVRGLPHIACPECEPERWRRIGEMRVPCVKQPQKRNKRPDAIERETLLYLREGERQHRDMARDLGLSIMGARDRLKRLRTAGLVKSHWGSTWLSDAGRKRLAEIEATEERAPGMASAEGSRRGDGRIVGTGDEVSR